MASHRNSSGKSRRKILYGLLSVAAVLGAAQFAGADSFTWTGTDGTNPTFWDHVAVNWFDGTTTANSAWVDGGTATFNLAVPTAVVLQNDNIQVTGITFTTTGWNIASSGGTGVLQYGSTGTIAVNVAAATTSTISAAIADTTGGFVTSLSQSGGGILILSGVNTYSGTTTVTAGQISVSNDNQLGLGTGAGNILLNAGGLLANTTFTLNGARGITIGNATGGGNGQLSAAAGQILTYNGNIADAGGSGNSLNIGTGGTGTVVLGGTNTYLAGTTLTAGTLNFANAGNLGSGNLTFAGGTLQYATGNTLDISSRIANGASAVKIDPNGNTITFGTSLGSGLTGGLTTGGANGGTLKLNAANSYTGTTTLNNGTLVVANAQSLGSTSNPIQFNTNGATLDIALDSTIAAYNVGFTTNTNGAIVADKATAATPGLTETFGALAIANSALTITAGANVSGGTPGVSFTGATLTGSPTFTVASGLTLSIPTITGAGSITFNGAGANTIGTTSDTGNFTMSGTGSTSVTALNNTGSVTVSAGTATIGSIGSGTTVTLSGASTGTIGSINISSTVTKSSTGTWTFNGSGTYAGTTNISAGTVIIGSSSGTGTGPFGTGTISTTNTVVLETDGANARTINNPITLGNNGSATSVGGAGNLTFNGLFTNANNGGSLFPITNSGLTTIQGGLVLSNSAGSRTMNILGTGNVLISSAITPASGATGAQSLEYSGAGTMTLSSAGSFSGFSTFVSTITIATGAAPVTTTPVTTTGNSVLKISGNYTMGAGSTDSALLINGGTGSATTEGTLSLVDGTVNTLTINSAAAAGTILTLGNAAAKPVILNMEVGNAADKIALSTGQKASIGAGGVVVNITGLGNLSGTTQDLLTTANTAAFTAANFTLNTTSGNFGGYTVALSDATVGKLQLTETALVATPATAYWKGTLGDGTWNSFTGGNLNNTNWNTDATSGIDTHQVPGAATNVIFSANAATNFTTTLGGNITINSLEFSSNGSAVTINGANTLTLGTAGITVDASAPAPIINSNVALGVSQTWTNNSANALTVNGTISGPGNSLTKAGTGALVLGGSNTFTGGLTINDGIVQLTNAAALNATTPQSVTFGPSAPSTARLQLNGNSLTIGALSTNATPGTPIVENASPTATPATLTVSQSTNTTFAGTLQDGAGGGALSFVKRGSGALTLGSTANTYTGTTTVANGILQINGSLAASSAVSVTAAADNTTATLGGTGNINGSVVISTPTGSNRLNQITANGIGSTGTLTLASGLTLNSGAVGYFDINNGGSFDALNVTAGGLTLNSGSIIRVSAGLTSAATYNLITYTGANPTLTGVIFQDLSGNALSNSYGFSATGDVLSLTITPASAAAPSLTITTPATGARVMKNTSVAITGNVGNTGTATLNATLSNNAGNLTVSNFNPNSTITILQSGSPVGYTASIASTGSTLGARTFSIAATDPGASPTTATASGTLFVLDNRVVTSTNSPNFGLQHLGAAVSQSTSLTSPGDINSFTTVTVANAAADANGIAVTGGSPATPFDGSFTDTRTIGGTLTTLGTLSGNITLTTTGEISGESPINVAVTYSAQVFSGKANWNNSAGGTWGTDANWLDSQSTSIGAPGLAGALSIGDTATFADLPGQAAATPITLNLAPTLAALTFSATATTYTISGSGSINLQLAATPIDVATAATISVPLTGLGLNKTDAGTLTLTAPSTYTGNTTITSGVLQITTADNRLPISTILTLGDAGSNTGKLILGDGTTARNQTIAGLTTLTTNPANSIVGGGTANATLTVNGTTNTSFGGTLGGPGTNENNLALTKNGAGTLILTGNNTYSGNTTLTGGTLTLGSANAIGSTGLISFAANSNVGGTLQFTAANTTDFSSDARLNTAITSEAFSFDTNGQTVTFAGALTSAGSPTLTKTGAGTLIVNPGVFTSPGNTQINGGVLQALDGLTNSSRLTLNGTSTSFAIFQTQGSFQRFLGGSNSLVWNANSGFAAKGAPLTVTVDGGIQEFWGTNSFLGSGTSALVFGSPTADDLVEFTNSFALGAQAGSLSANFQRTFTVDGPGAAPSGSNIYGAYGFTGNRALVSGVISANNPYTVTSVGPPVVATGDFGNNGITKTGSGILILNNQNTYSGPTVVNAGTLVAGTNALVGVAGAFGDGHAVTQTPPTGNVIINGTQSVTLGGGNQNGTDGTAATNASPALYIGGAFSVEVPINVANFATTGTYTIGGSMDANATFGGLITLAQPLTVTQIATTGSNALNIIGGFTGSVATTTTKTVTFNNVGAVKVAPGTLSNSTVTTGAITDGAGGGKIAVTLNGPGLTTFSAPSTYSGNTTLNAGTFLVANTSGSATGTSALTLNGGILGGYGTISGTVTAGSGPHTIAPSATLSPTATGTLTLGGLTTAPSTTLQFNLVTPTNSLLATTSNSDTLMVTGANGLTLNGGTINLTNHATGPASLGFYKVIAYSGAIGGTGIGSLTLPATVANVEYTFDTTHDAGFVDIHRGFAGDVDDSGFVDINDLAILAAHWQQTGGWAQGNFLNDPLVDINDLAILAANWQTGITSFGEAADSLAGTSQSFQQAVATVVFGNTTPVPEPTTLALLGISAAALLARRRNRR